jgi:hypothetical protein
MKRTFALDDQRGITEMSGDGSPMYVDAPAPALGEACIVAPGEGAFRRWAGGPTISGNPARPLERASCR